MLLWFSATLLALGGLAIVGFVLFRRQPVAPSREASADIAVYSDQLLELEQDVARGLIETDEAEAARTEIARRLLRASRDGAGSAGGPRGGGAIPAFLATIMILIACVAAYVSLGAPGYRDQPLASRDRDAAPPSFEALLAAAEQRLHAQPEDGRGWALIAPVYMQIGRFDDAADAYRNANDLIGPSPPLLTGYGEALLYANDGLISAAAVDAFRAALEGDPSAVKPQLYLAIAARQAGDSDEAVSRWLALSRQNVARDAWLPVARKEFGLMGRDIALLGEAGLPAPGEAAIAPPPAMDAEVTPAMIEGMVARLRDRLDSQGGSADEWIRLVRSYVVLGRIDDAEQIASQARGVYRNDPQAMHAIDRAAADLGLTEIR